MTPIDLHSKTRKKLSEIARDRSIQRWHSMKKQELINAIIALNKKEISQKTCEDNHFESSCEKTSARHLEASHKERSVPQLSHSNVDFRLSGGADSDELQLQATNPSWVFAKWKLTSDILERAFVALGRKWHSSKPVLRIYEVSQENSSLENLLRHEIEIHGNMNHWYVYIHHVPATIVAHIGYLSDDGQFYVLAKSSRIEVKQSVSEKPSSASSPSLSSSLVDVNLGGTETDEIDFQLDVELLLRGSAHPYAEIDLDGNIIKADDQGDFEFRMNLPNGRQVIPAVMVTSNGEARKTIVLGVERSTKELDPEALAQY